MLVPSLFASLNSMAVSRNLMAKIDSALNVKEPCLDGSDRQPPDNVSEVRNGQSLV